MITGAAQFVMSLITVIQIRVKMEALATKSEIILNVLALMIFTEKFVIRHLAKKCPAGTEFVPIMGQVMSVTAQKQLIMVITVNLLSVK